MKFHALIEVKDWAIPFCVAWDSFYFSISVLCFHFLWFSDEKVTVND